MSIKAIKIKVKIGANGELELPATIREELGLTPGKEIFQSIEKGKLIIESVPDLRVLLKSKKPKVTISTTELRKDRAELSEEVES